MRSFASRLLTLLCIATIGLPILTSPVRAASNSWAVFDGEDYINAIIDTVSGAIQKEGSDTHSTLGSIFTYVCDILGCTDKIDPATGRLMPFHYNRSFVAYAAGGIGYVYANPPATTAVFAIDLGKTLGFLPRTYAQGVGFTNLTALLPIWKAFRNIAYGIIAIIMVIIGFMVMLRKKIDPKTVVTVQNSIPRVVIALLLVTFSYAIVGFMIDLMYVFMALLMNLIIGADPARFAGNTVQSYIRSNFGTTMGAFAHGLGVSILRIAEFFPMWAYPVSVGVSTVIGFIFSGFRLGGAVSGALALPAVALLVIALTVLFGMVRLFFMLLDAYIHIIIALITAPLHLMLEAIPGTNAFGSWFRNLLSKLIVFPTVAAVFLLTLYLTSDEASVGQIWSPPFLAGTTANGNPLIGLISLGMLLSIPAIVAGLQKPLKGEPIIPAGLATIAGPLGTGLGQVVNLAYQLSFITSAFRKHGPSPYQQATAAGSTPITSILQGKQPGGGGEH